MSKQHCYTCETDKDPDDFYESSPKKCKACVLARQKEIKAMKASGTPVRAKKETGAKKKTKAAAVVPHPDSRWERPSGFGFAVELHIDDDKGQTDIHIEQSASELGQQHLWLNQSEARELHSWLTEKLGL